MGLIRSSQINLIIGCGLFIHSVAAGQPVGIPVLVSEPQYTSGTVNTLTWSSVHDAHSYLVQVDDSPQFKSPISSAWVESTSCTLTDLPNGLLYYRVKARRADDGTTITWAQDTAAEFEESTIVGLNSRVPGSVDNLMIPQWDIVDKSFEGWYGWTQVANDPWRNLSYDASQSSPGVLPTDGNKSAQFYNRTKSNFYSSAYYSIYQIVDFSGYQKLLYDFEAINGGVLKFETLIDGKTEFSYGSRGTFLDKQIDLSTFKGVHKIEFRTSVANIYTVTNTQEFLVDNIRLFPSPPAFTTGSITSPPIRTDRLQRWLNFTCAIDKPTSSDIILDVLPESGDEPIPGFANVPAKLDLSNLNASTIRLRAKLFSYSPAALPKILGRSGGWKVSFVNGYTEGLFSSLVSSIQDSVAPVAILENVTPNPNNTRLPNYKISFSEPVSNFDVTDIKLVRNGTDNLEVSDKILTAQNNKTWILDLSSLLSTDGVYSLTVNPSDIKDAAGLSPTTAVTHTWIADYTSPVPAITSTGNDFSASPIPIVVSFSEEMSEFTPKDLVAKNCRVIGLTTNTRGISFPCMLYPLKPGWAEVSLPAGACSDLAGNPVLAGASYSCRFTGTPVFPPNVDLKRTNADIAYYGGDNADFFSYGFLVATGDVNGDGYLDVVTAASDADGPGNARNLCGDAYVFYGRSDMPPVLDVAGLVGQSPDVTIYGRATRDDLGSRGGPIVGDITGDGIDDIMIGAMYQDGINGIDSGGGYIIFGSSTLPSVIDLADPPANTVTVIYGAQEGKLSWHSGAIMGGDLNGDGYQDFVLGSHLEVSFVVGRAYVIFGRPAATWPDAINLAVLQPGMCRITGPSYWGSGYFFTKDNAMAHGDFTGDGIDDLVLGAGRGSGPEETPRSECGRVYLIKGRKTWPAEINLASAGGADMTVFGAYTNQAIGSERSNFGLQDIDGDGFEDLMISHSQVYLDAPPGSVYIIYGSAVPPTSIDLALGQQDCTINGIDVLDMMMMNCALPLADVNNDGHLDIVLYALYGDGANNDRALAGDGYIIFGNGSRLPKNIDLALPPAGVKISFIYAETRATLSHVATGDLNSDGIADVVFRTHTDADVTGVGPDSLRLLLGRTVWPDIIDLVSVPADSTIQGDVFGDYYPETVDIADINSDGADDLVIGCGYGDGPNYTRENAGEIHVVLGLSGNAATSAIIDWSLYK